MAIAPHTQKCTTEVAVKSAPNRTARISGHVPERLPLIDSSALFLTVSGDIPVVSTEGTAEDTRRIEAISRLNRAVPGEASAHK